jgi:hypothetical protein
MDTQYETLHSKLTNEELRLKIQAAAKKLVLFRENIFKNYLDPIV